MLCETDDPRDINTNNVGSYTGLYWYMVCQILAALFISNAMLTCNRIPDMSRQKTGARASMART